MTTTRPLYDIDQKIEHNRELAESERDPKTRWALERRTASYEWQRDSKAFYEREGSDFFDHRQWELDRRWAMLQHEKSSDRHRREEGDREILAKLDSLAQSRVAADSGYKVTPARRKVIEALVRLTGESSVLYCSYASLACEARVSPRTGHTVRAELESFGVLKRIRTGGKAADGTHQTNKYIVSWQHLRALLGIEIKWESRRGLVVEQNPFRPNAFYNYEGYAHYSMSARQMRRIRKRIQDLAAERARLRAAAVEKAARDLERAAANSVEKAENGIFEQGFCTVTALQLLKTPKVFQPGLPPLLYRGPIVENGTRQSRSHDGRPSDGKGEFSFDPSLFGRSTSLLLSRVKDHRVLPLLHEVEVMVQQNHNFDDEPSAQSHAEEILRVLLDADRTLFS